MLGVIRTVIFIVGLYYVIRFISRYILPMFTEKKQPARDTHIHSGPKPRNQKYSADDGEYVDYEEIK